MSKVVLGMSGGVDSSVAAYLLKKEGHQVIGVFMQNWEDDDRDDYCTIKQDAHDVITVADLLDIEVEIVNFAAIYKERVFNYFLAEYAKGRTPNPDIFCNSEIKFKAFLDYALKLGAEYIATGHYVAKINNSKGVYLSRALDHHKDQSYFLYRLNSLQIAHSLFPLANITKTEIRTIAAQLKLPNAQKKDSTGICFIGKRPFRQFLSTYFSTASGGEMITPTGDVVGIHYGLMYYTIGQRKGLNIGGIGAAWFVAQKNLSTNQLIVVQGHDHPLLFSQTLIADNLCFNFILNEGRYSAKTRYRMQDAVCTLKHLNSQQIQLDFVEPQWAVTAGQSVVLYQDSLCLGGGIIVNSY